MSSIEITGLTMRFAQTPVLKDLDLQVRTSTVTAILGSSGSGKSTLLRCLAGLLRPEQGVIQIGSTVVFGKGIWVPPERRGIGLVPQEGSLFPHLSVGDNVGYGLRGRNSGGRIAHLLDLVGLPGTSAMRPHELSGGMQQRVAVARRWRPRRTWCFSMNRSPRWMRLCETTCGKTSSRRSAQQAPPRSW